MLAAGTPSRCIGVPRGSSRRRREGKHRHACAPDTRSARVAPDWPRDVAWVCCHPGGSGGPRRGASTTACYSTGDDAHRAKLSGPTTGVDSAMDVYYRLLGVAARINEGLRNTLVNGLPLNWALLFAASTGLLFSSVGV